MAMLTIKNRAQCFLLAALALTACAPAGPRALLEGKKRLDRGQYEHAIARLEDATSILHTNAQAWNYLGLAYHYSGRSEEALQAYNRSLSLDRGLSEARYNLGCLQMEMNRPDQARATFTTLTLEQEQNPEGHLKLGTAASRVGDLSAAERAFQTALKLSPDSPEALTGLGVVRQKRGRSAEAADFLARAIKADPEYAPALLNYAVVAQHSLKDRPLAMRLYNQYLSIKPLPSNSGPVIVAATELQRELAKSTMLANNVSPLTHTPGTSSPLHQTGSVRAVQQAVTRSNAVPRHPEAAKPISKTGEAVPHVTTTTTQHVAQTAAPHPKPVETNAAKATKTDKRSIISRILGSGKTPDPGREPVPAQQSNQAASPGVVSGYAYENPSRPVPGDRRDAERLFQQALAARRGLRVTEAVKLYQQASQADASYFDPHFNLAVTLTDLGDLQNAADAYERALAVRSDSFDARFNFALLLNRMGFPSDAARELEKLTRSHPKDARPLVLLGNIYSQQLKHRAKAREYYAKAVETDPTTPQAAAIRQWLADPRN